MKESRFIPPDKWIKLSKHLKWRCCKCDNKHTLKFKVQNNEIYMKEWKPK